MFCPNGNLCILNLKKNNRTNILRICTNQSERANMSPDVFIALLQKTVCKQRVVNFKFIERKRFFIPFDILWGTGMLIVDAQ